MDIFQSVEDNDQEPMGIQMDFLLMLAVQLIIVVLCCIVVQLSIRILDSNMSC